MDGLPHLSGKTPMRMGQNAPSAVDKVDNCIIRVFHFLLFFLRMSHFDRIPIISSF